jgi:hypothetical protein
MTELNLDTLIDERGKAAWENLPESLTVANDYEGLHELLLASRGDPEFPDILRRAMLAMHRRGRESGITEIAKGLLALSTDETPQ